MDDVVIREMMKSTSPTRWRPPTRRRSRRCAQASAGSPRRPARSPTSARSRLRPLPLFKGVRLRRQVSAMT
eukprot:1246359-Pleurochrysis_carterae.AAC.1